MMEILSAVGGPAGQLPDGLRGEAFFDDQQLVGQRIHDKAGHAQIVVSVLGE